MIFGLPRQFWGSMGFFMLFGMAFGVWGGHVASIETQIGDSEATFGLALLGAAIGLVISAPLVGPLSKRLGTATVLRVGWVLYLFAMCRVFWITNPVELFLFTFVIGITSGAIDVAVNAQVSITERQTGHKLLSRAHAMWSLGGVLGAGSALLFLTFGVRDGQIWGALVFMATLGTIAMFNLYTREDETELDDDEPDQGKADGLGGWSNPILLLMGFVALMGLLIESGMMDWSPIYFSDYRGTTAAGSAMVFTFFSAVMFLTRMFGDVLRNYLRDKHILIGGAVISGFALALGLMIDNNFWAMVVMSIAGIGIAFVYPLVTSRAAAYRAPGQTNASAAGNIAVVTGIGYGAILVAPPVIGLVSESTSLFWGMMMVAICGPLMAILAAYLPRQQK